MYQYININIFIYQFLFLICEPKQGLGNGRLGLFNEKKGVIWILPLD